MPASLYPSEKRGEILSFLLRSFKRKGKEKEREPSIFAIAPGFEPSLPISSETHPKARAVAKIRRELNWPELHSSSPAFLRGAVGPG